MKPEPKSGDALLLFRQAQMAEPRRKFESGEHVWLGNAAVHIACDEAKIPRSPFMALTRSANDEQFSYGEIVALSGDFYGSPESLFEEKSSVLPWFGNDVADLRTAFDRELDWIQRGVGPYPDNTRTLYWNAKNYVELALGNVAHFGWHNIVAYCRYHTEAISYALLARQDDDDDPLWLRAVFFNAFADHFLSDAFAAGHIRVPRAEIRAWCREMGYSDKLAGGLSKLLHDQDGHISTFHSNGESDVPYDEGLHVKNALGLEWRTRCDAQLFIASDDERLIGEPVRAMADSLSELFQARSHKTVPDRTFKAISHAPFPHPAGKTLVQKFAADISPEALDKLMDSIAWYMNIPWIGSGISRENVLKLLHSLPALMKRFRNSVSATATADAGLQKRLPPEYVKAFASIA